MAKIKGLIGLRPSKEEIVEVTCPPYDVIKEGSVIEGVLKKRDNSLYHVTLGKKPGEALQRLINQEIMLPDEEPCYYVYEQNYDGISRTGVLSAVEVSDYARGEIIRHEKTFDDKVKGRLELRSKTGYTFEPVFLLTEAKIEDTLENIKQNHSPVYEFNSDFENNSELHGIYNRIYRIPEASSAGIELQKNLSGYPLYIADGHHRYHASLLNNQTHFLGYICPTTKVVVQAYNRLINGKKSFGSIIGQIPLQETDIFTTPMKHCFAIYTKDKSFLLEAQKIPNDVIGKLDCSILEKELYPILGLTHELIMDPRHFDYYPEAELEQMKKRVDAGEYEIAVALHPVSIEELVAVANAGIKDPQIVMPEKSTYFSPKILSGIMIYRHICK